MEAKNILEWVCIYIDKSHSFFHNSAVPPLICPLHLHWRSRPIRGVDSLDEDTLVVFYYHSGIWNMGWKEGGGLWWEQSYKRGTNIPINTCILLYKTTFFTPKNTWCNFLCNCNDIFIIKYRIQCSFIFQISRNILTLLIFRNC